MLKIGRAGENTRTPHFQPVFHEMDKVQLRGRLLRLKSYLTRQGYINTRVVRFPDAFEQGNE